LTYLARIVFMGAMALVTACSFQGTSSMRSRNESDLTDQLVRLERERLNAYVRHDAPVLERDLAPEYVHINLYGTRTNKSEEIAEFYISGRFTLAGGDIAHPVVHRYGEVAVLQADVTWTGASYKPDNGQAVDLSGVYSITRIYAQSGGRWLVVASHASRQRPSSTP